MTTDKFIILFGVFCIYAGFLLPEYQYILQCITAGSLGWAFSLCFRVQRLEEDISIYQQYLGRIVDILEKLRRVDE